uniref:Ccmf_ii n=1 Tax=Halteria grandinella TaxID=5974 RepID=A0A7T0M4R4_HALGN|nr:ccmf_ii [Halteria grandinella]QPL15976.1 ccmf_ii [Halteria grandinella]
MLFQRLYNWIKYKTLPPSFLFKNRLFIERDSKHRRVLSNFGLSFRNSKWSNYETYNIKLHFKNNYLKFLFSIFFFFIFLIVIINFNKYYIFSYIFNSLSFFFWIGIDSLDYYLSFLIWIVSLSISLFFNLIYSYFFFNNFYQNNNSTSINSEYKKLNINSLNKKTTLISKNDLNWVLYSWLTNTNSSNNNIILEKLFDTKLNNTNWNNNFDFFIKLYKLSFYSSLLSKNNNFFQLNNNINSFKNNFFQGNYYNLIYFFNNNKLINNNTSLILNYFLKNYNNYYNLKFSNTTSTKYNNNRFIWNLNNFNQELEKFPFLLKFKNGFFFINNFNYQQLNNLILNFNELWVLNPSFKNQIISAKWNRWLYRYSILHRKILKNSHKLTLTKRLLNSGFYESKIFNKNIWATEHLNKISQSDYFSSIFNSHYSNLFNKKIINNFNYKALIDNNDSQINSLNLLNFYENSYFWYLKRFYNFNTMSTNFIKSKLNLNNNFLNIESKLNNDLNNTNFKYNIFLNYFLNSSKNNLSKFSHSNNTILNINDLSINSNLNKSFNNFFNLKDFYILLNENDLFSKDLLNILFWITTTNLNNTKISFFDSLMNLNYKFNPSFNNFINNSNKDQNVEFWLTLSLINTDSIYLKDSIYLNYFLN